MFTSKIKFTKDMQKELLKTQMVWCLIFCIIGAMGLVVYIFVGDFLKYELAETILLISAFVFACGLIFYLIFKRTIKQIGKLNVTNAYEFYEDYFKVESTKNDEVIGTSKIYYKDLAKYKKTKNYIFLYQSSKSAFPVELNDLGDLNVKMLTYLIDKSKGKMPTKKCEE